MSITQRNRPGDHPEAASKRLAARDQDTEPAPAPRLSHAEIETSLPLYVIVTKSPTDRINRRVYLSLHSAVKAVQRAEQRGNAAELTMMRCAPYKAGGADE